MKGHVLAEIVRLDRDHHRRIGRDTDLVAAVKLLARAQPTARWERTPSGAAIEVHAARLFPGRDRAFEGFGGARLVALLARAPSPARAGTMTRRQVVSALRPARRSITRAGPGARGGMTLCTARRTTG